jgi:hypothetical protein
MNDTKICESGHSKKICSCVHCYEWRRRIAIPWYRAIFHKCFLLERSCKGINGMILKCKECDRRYVIQWEDYKEMIKGVKTD